MAKTKVSEWDAVPGNNTDIDSINIAEGCAPSGINNAIRELMSQVKDFQQGTYSDPFNGPVNGTIGATTPAAGAFTTLAASGAVTLSGGTANGVAYLNGSKVLTSGSALTFDGSTFGVKGSGQIAAIESTGDYSSSGAGFIRFKDSTGNRGYVGFGGTSNLMTVSNTVASAALNFELTGTERMRLTSTGLGIGTSSPVAKLDVRGGIYLQDGNNNGAISATSSSGGQLYINTYSNQIWQIQGAEKMRLDSSGNLGIGTSSPGAKISVQGAQGTEGAMGILSQMLSTTAYNASPIAGISLGTTYNAGGSSAGMGGIAVGKENATDGNYAGYLALYTRPNGGSTAERMRIDSAGNLGLGVTPSASTTKQFEIGYAGQGLSSRSGILNYVLNGTYNSGWKYAGTGAVSNFELYNGTFAWYTAPSGTAGNAISFTQAMTLNASGQLLLGTTSAGTTDAPLIVSNAGAAGMEFSPTAISGENRLLSYNRSTSAYAGFTLSASDIKFQTGGTERARIDSSGNVGIGTSSPDTGVHLRVYGNAYYTAQYGTGNKGRFGADATGAFIDAVGATPLVFQTNTTERARIDSSGNLLVGTTSANFSPKFAVTSGASDNTTVQLTGNYTAFHVVNSSNTSYTPMKFWNNGVAGTVGSISCTTSATSYSTSSDYRLKENIKPMTGALSVVQALKPCTYNWKADGSDGQGFIAHELAEVAPQCVTGEKDAVDADGNPVYQGIDTSFLVATLTAAIQELKAEFDAYKATHP